MGRVYGPDLMLEIMTRTNGTEHRHFIFGGGEGVVDLLVLKLSKSFPKLRFVGKMTPPFRPLNQQEDEELANLILKSNVIGKLFELLVVLHQDIVKQHM